MNVEMREEANVIQNEPLDARKRAYEEHIRCEQLIARFKSRADFITYFEEARKYLSLLNILNTV